MSVSGKYVNKFEEASHVLFDGTLDDPTFRELAIQKIESIEGMRITTDKSGEMLIEKWKGKYRVRLEYMCLLFGKQVTWGYPFKDANTPIIGTDRRK